MTDQSPEGAQFFLTGYSDCPYIEGNQERKLFTHLSGRRAPALHGMLSEYGFRRSQNIIYRPACENCNRCRSSRVVCAEFEPSKRFRRIFNKNTDLLVSVREPVASFEQFDLFVRYLSHRHDDGGMANMDYSDYEYMVEDTPVRTQVIEYRLVDEGAKKLVAVALSDITHDGMSMVYSFFDPDYSRRSLGSYMILDHIDRGQLMGLDYIYLGYWVEGSPKMEYKAHYQPLEILGTNDQWQRLK